MIFLHILIENVTYTLVSLSSFIVVAIYLLCLLCLLCLIFLFSLFITMSSINEIYLEYINEELKNNKETVPQVSSNIIDPKYQIFRKIETIKQDLSVIHHIYNEVKDRSLLTNLDLIPIQNMLNNLTNEVNKTQVSQVTELQILVEAPAGVDQAWSDMKVEKNLSLPSYSTEKNLSHKTLQNVYDFIRDNMCDITDEDHDNYYDCCLDVFHALNNPKYSDNLLDEEYGNVKLSTILEYLIKIGLIVEKDGLYTRTLNLYLK